MSQNEINQDKKNFTPLNEEIPAKILKTKPENEINEDNTINTINTESQFKTEVKIIGKKIKKYYLIIKSKKHLIDYFCLTLNIVGIILYIISLYRCSGGQENTCVSSGFVRIFKKLAFLDFIDGLLTSVSIILIFLKKAKIYHLIYLIIIYGLLYVYDHGDDFNRHGSFSIMIFILFLAVFVISFSFIIFLVNLIIKRNLIQIFIIIIIIFFIFQYIKYISKVSYCDYWDEGLNFTKIENNPNTSCVFKKPPNCKMQFYYGKLDLSKLVNVPNFNKKSTAVQYLSKELKKSNYLGYPYTNRIPVKNVFNNFFFHNFVPEHMINMETFNETEDNPRPEITVKFDENGVGKVDINLQKNETLAKERKALENPNSKFKNILIIFIDAVSRARFLLALKKLSQFIGNFMTFKEENFSAFQFFKFHALGSYTHINAQPMFYGNAMSSNSGIDFAKYAKENGYITGQSNDHCAHTLYNDEKQYGTKNVEAVFWDHENFALFCDPNYYDKKFSSSYNRGPSSFTKRILYGKNAFEYELEYLKQFWVAYKDNKKLFRMAFMDAHEDTQEVIKYLDRPLTNFMLDFYSNGYLDDTFVMFVSDHGLHFPRVFGFLALENYLFERSLPSLFIICGKKIDYSNIILNQQKMVTPYDIFNTLMQVIYGDDFEKLNVHTTKGISLFNYIEEENRTCNYYDELKNSEHCRCY